MTRARFDPDADLRRRSPWRLLVPVLAFVAVALAAIVTRLAGAPATGALVLSGGYGLIALWALVDGARRLFGQSTFLGTGRGLDRLFGLIQALASVGIAFALLPNAIALLNFLAQLATG